MFIAYKLIGHFSIHRFGKILFVLAQDDRESSADDHHSQDHVALLQAMRTGGGFKISLRWDEEHQHRVLLG